MTPFAPVAVAASSAPGGVVEVAAAALQRRPVGPAMTSALVCVIPAGRTPVEVEPVVTELRAAGVAVLLGDDRPTDWACRCLEQAAVVLLVGRGGGEPRLGPVELLVPPPTGDRRIELLLVHDADATWVGGTAAWLAERALSAHHHVRTGRATEIRRVADALVARAPARAPGQAGPSGQIEEGAWG